MIVPNLRASLLSAAFLTLAIVMGEFTMSVLMQFTTFAVYINYVGATQAQGAAALSLLSFGITWVAMLGILALGRRPGARQVQIGGTALMAHLELRSVTKRFGPVAALDDVTLALEKGEFFSMLGPSGCGKTTALRIVAGFETPDAGQVLVDGNDITRVPPNKRDMGMVFQAYSLFPNLTARDRTSSSVCASAVVSRRIVPAGRTSCSIS